MVNAYTRAMDSLALDECEKECMAVALEARAREAQASGGPHVALAPEIHARKRSHIKLAAALVVAAVLAVGGTAYALGGVVGLGQFVDHLFGGAEPEVQIVQEVGRPMGVSAADKGVTVSADAIIGDRSNVAVVFSITRDDGEFFEGIEPMENGLLPLSFSEKLGVEHPTFASWSSYGASYFYDADPSDNAIQLVETLSVLADDGELGLVGRTMAAQFSDLTYYPAQGDPVVLAPGSWKLSFPLNYEDASLELGGGQTFRQGGNEAAIDSLSISPIGLSVAYRVTTDRSREPQEDGKDSSQNASLADDLLTLDVAITMADGTTVAVADGGGGSMEEEDGVIRCKKGLFFDRIVDLDEVESVSVGGITVPVRS